MANFIALQNRGLLPAAHYERMRPILRKNYGDFAETSIPIHSLFAALMKDKKNTNVALRLIFPVGDDGGHSAGTHVSSGW